MMNRRAFLKTSSAVLLSAPMLARLSFADTPSTALLTIDLKSDGVPISKDFLGFSYEGTLLSNPDFLSVNNSSLLALYSLLGRNGVVRIGGITSDQIGWNSPTSIKSTVGKHDLTPADLERTAMFVRKTGWKCIYGLNMGNGTVADAADEARYAAEYFKDTLLAFQIGNEPDLYGSNGNRPRTYRVEDYLAERKVYVSAVKAQVPWAKFYGPDTAYGANWTSELAAADPEDVSCLTTHYYSEGPASSPDVTVEVMMGSAGQVDDLLSSLSSLSKRTGLPFRMSETNSVYGGGKFGVSDTEAAAVWSIHYMLQVAAAGGSGINFHGSTYGAYSPVIVRNGVSEPTPMFYSMLMFAQIGPGSIIPAVLTGAPDGLSAYAIRGKHHKLSVLLINSSLKNAADVTIDLPSSHLGKSVLTLTSPSPLSGDGITLGGNAITSANTWQPMATAGSMKHSSTSVITVPPSTAMLIK